MSPGRRRLFLRPGSIIIVRRRDWVLRLVRGRPVPGLNDSRVFAGDRLLCELNRFFEGVHLNTSLIPGTNQRPVVFNPPERVHLTTAADFLWNPQKWEPAESYRRTVRFVEVMRPLFGDKAGTQVAPDR